MRFRGLDLNLLVALDALIAERNLTAAARSINLSQPAMSAAVARLRAYFKDELFTMSGRELVLTPRAEALASPTREALLHIQLSITSREPFRPDESNRRFRLCMSDFAAIVLIRKVIERVAREAPGIKFELMPLADPFDHPLQRGAVDFIILPDVYTTDEHPKATLFDETLVCVGCRSNKRLARPLTFSSYMSMGHVAVRFGRSRVPSIDEWFMQEHRVKRRVEVVVQGFSMMPHMLVGTNRVATMPATLVRHFAKSLPLRVAKLPLPLPGFTETLQWPALHNNEPASKWMRQVLLEEAARLGSSQEEPSLAPE
ncbi:MULTISPECIES: LysR family transcriptional regulator [Bradyrhizobium]|uniref:LysR family transcriptional regulator n=3 Tax=Bradyrhizobium TaxID=374 RepID=A0AAE6CCD8_9BRAD|nr:MULTISPECIES: LysR family transcriptional regulator [Bradyrhizobium]MCG2632927.1 LysR family transcriptional regulator [Bradyrhizobium zhengyangense]MCG2645533.1 LysR family transcriptional regulator [Bradyrhizobium zhengyangense]MCG2673130.1 LysR family transcriptional regulator [Bradyrhizobium zhengyangense]MDN4985658.1 LysR family transcriptional regulator [Bradyrhizobium sp. WYCCWR 13022]MDN5006118.1 LysR family transcriptional regulator [Bradyrhizobium sp. WYCCWR 12677]